MPKSSQSPVRPEGQQQMTVTDPPVCVKPPFWQKKQMYFMLILVLTCVVLVAAACCVAFLKDKPISRSSKPVTVYIQSPVSSQLEAVLQDDFQIHMMLKEREEDESEISRGDQGESNQQNQQQQQTHNNVPHQPIRWFNTTETQMAKLRELLEKENVSFTIVP